MKNNLKGALFLLFFVSGFCGLLYQLVWIRLAYASFGIITPVLSVIISVFMLGLSLGAWAGGALIELLARKTKLSPAVFYAAAECVIGLGAFAVPGLFALGQSLLMSRGGMDSFSYLFLSGLAITASIFPWCVCMGATFPFMMSFIRKINSSSTANFSFLYLANVIGAMAGTLFTSGLMIEDFGFRVTLWIAGALNFMIALAAFSLRSEKPAPEYAAAAADAPLPVFPAETRRPLTALILFTTGFTSLGMEIVWTRAFTPVFGNEVYSFALLMFVYFLATWLGSFLYRRALKRGAVMEKNMILPFTALFALLPIAMSFPGAPWAVKTAAALFSVFPFCLALGYLTPYLIDAHALGDPAKAGRIYAFNIFGCIAGPLFASYVLLPAAGAKMSFLLLSLPFFGFLFYYLGVPHGARTRRAVAAASVSLFCYTSLFSYSYEVPMKLPAAQIKRDYAATVICFGKGMGKELYVNGIGITSLTSVTKFMAHLPLAFHEGRPGSALVICFGMGTTYRSLLSWGIDVTAVELVPGVRGVFGYFHDDAAAVLKNPRGQIIIDDGRRFLLRSRKKYDVITVDPPPPLEAAGSSLLYSEEFYALVKEHLNPGGMFQQWVPIGLKGASSDEITSWQAIARSMANSFRYVRVYVSVRGWGCHFIASQTSFETPSPGEMLKRMPPAAVNDLMEWNIAGVPKLYVKKALDREVPLNLILARDESLRITDDRPFNEYYVMRWLCDKIFGGQN